MKATTGRANQLFRNDHQRSALPLSLSVATERTVPMINYVFPEYRIGNILDAPLHDMMQSNRRFGEYKLDSLPTQCLHCDVADLCFGGCPKDRLIERMTLGSTAASPIGAPTGGATIERRNYLCPGYKQFFQYIRRKYPEIVNRAAALSL